LKFLYPALLLAEVLVQDEHLGFGIGEALLQVAHCLKDLFNLRRELGPWRFSSEEKSSRESIPCAHQSVCDASKHALAEHFL
jgi:hypothetical protein